MHAAAYFVPPVRGTPQAGRPAYRFQYSGALSDTVNDPSRERLPHRMIKLAVVAGLHLALFGWLAQVDGGRHESDVPVRLEVRTIAVSAAPSEASSTSMNEIASRTPKALPPMARPVAPRIKKSVNKPATPRSENLLTAQAGQASAVDYAVPQASASGKAEELTVQTSTRASSTANPASAGGTVSAARFDADYLRNPAPAYPVSSRRQREEGKVQLNVTVTAEGRAAEVSVRQSSGYARLDQAALETVKQWRFVPARRGNEAVVAQVIVPIEFRLAN